MKKILGNYKILIAALVALVVVGVAIYFLASFRLVGSSPKNKATGASITSAITLNFSKTLSSLVPAYTFSPSAKTKISLSGKTITITPVLPLTNSTKYTLVLTGIKSSGGKILQSTTLSFTTQSLAASTANLLQTLPHLNGQYSISFNPIDQNYLVTINQAPVDTSKAAALNYLAQYGVAPSNSTINYYTIPGVDGSSGYGP